LVWRGGQWRDVFTGRHIDLKDPRTIEAAIRSGAVGMGSFLTPLLHCIPHLAISHLSSADYIHRRQGTFAVAPVHRSDELLDPTSPCPAVTLLSNGQALFDCPTGARYRATSDVAAWTANLPAVPTFLHIDMDYFCNPFNRDSDWRHRPDRHNADTSAVLDSINGLFETLATGVNASQIVNVTLALPAGFFPAQLWQPSMERIEQHVTRLHLPSPFSEGGSHGS
jgi:hypothetical protein